MKPFLILLLTCLTASAQTVTKAQAIAAEQRARANTLKQQAALDAANADNASLKDQLGQTQLERGAAEQSVATLKGEIAVEHQARLDAEATVAKQAAELAHLSKLAHIVALVLASLAAFFVFREMKPTGLLSFVAPQTLIASIVGPVIVFGIVEVSAEAYLRHWL